MTRDESLIIVKRIRSLYISQSRNYTEADWQAMAEAFYETFVRDAYEDVNRAVTLYVDKGKSFMPNVADIIHEMTDIDEPAIKKLFERLRRECDKATGTIPHVVIDDLGGLRKDPTSPTGWIYVHPESHETRNYTQQDFANMPEELQLYTEDIKGLQGIAREIGSDPDRSYRRFRERIRSIRKSLERRGEGYEQV